MTVVLFTLPVSPRLKSALALGGSFLLGGGLLWLALRGADLATVGAAFADADWRWLGALVPLSVASVAVRAWRWQLLLRALPDTASSGGEARYGTVFAATFIGYLVNYAAPRLGEVARTATVSQRSRHGFAGVFGTVVGERVLDVVVLALAVVGTAALYGDRLGAVGAQALATARALGERLTPAVLGLAALAAVALAGGALWWARRGGLGTRLAGLVGSFRDGLATLGRTGRAPALVASTLALWACYVLLADVPLRMLGLSQAYGLGVLDAFAVMTVGAIGIALPSPGGTGSYHYATVQTLALLFGVAASPAASYAVLAHAAQVVFYCVGGFAALLALGTSFRAVRASAEAA